MIVATDGGAEKSHHLITDELIQSAVVAKDRVRRRLIKAIELGSHFRWLELLGKRGEAANLDEQDRDVDRLPARRSQLVSKRAKIGILARRTNLQQTKRQRADAEKRHETFFAAFAGREKTIESPRHLGRTEPLAKRDKKVFHKVVLKTYSKRYRKTRVSGCTKKISEDTKWSVGVLGLEPITPLRHSITPVPMRRLSARFGKAQGNRRWHMSFFQQAAKNTSRHPGSRARSAIAGQRALSSPNS